MLQPRGQTHRRTHKTETVCSLVSRRPPSDSIIIIIINIWAQRGGKSEAEWRRSGKRRRANGKWQMAEGSEQLAPSVSGTKRERVYVMLYVMGFVCRCQCAVSSVCALAAHLSSGRALHKSLPVSCLSELTLTSSQSSKTLFLLSCLLATHSQLRSSKIQQASQEIIIIGPMLFRYPLFPPSTCCKIAPLTCETGALISALSYRYLLSLCCYISLKMVTDTSRKWIKPFGVRGAV